MTYTSLEAADTMRFGIEYRYPQPVQSMIVLCRDSAIYCSIQSALIFAQYIQYTQYLAIAVPIRKEVVVAVAFQRRSYCA